MVRCTSASRAGGLAAQHGDGGLGGAVFDVLDLIGGHASPPGQVGDAEAQGAALVVHGFAQSHGLADGGPVWIFDLVWRADQRVW